MLEAKSTFRGILATRKINAPKAPLAWRIRNALRWNFVWGWFVNYLAKAFSKLTGIVTMTSQLSVRAHVNGRWIDYGVVSRRVITTAGVTEMAKDFKDGTGEITNFKYHGCGTGVGAEAIGDTALGTESTTALNPDSTRATGTNTNPSAKVYQSVGTLTFDASAAITEHGILSQAATGGGILWDRSVFAAINVGSGDSIQFTYQLTCNDNG